MTPAVHNLMSELRGDLLLGDGLRLLATVQTVLAIGRRAELRETALLEVGDTPEDALRAYREPVELPQECRRKTLVAAATDPRARLIDGLEALRAANPELAHLFAVDALVDRVQGPHLAHVLKALNDRVLDDPTGGVSEIVERWTLDTEPSTWTAPSLVALLIDLTGATPGMRVANLHSRTGELLEGLLARSIPPQSIVCQEPNHGAADLADLRVLSLGKVMPIRRGDPLFSPLEDEGGALLAFDRVIGVTPFGIKLQPDQVARLDADRHGRFRHGPGLHRGTSEVAFLQHCLACLAPGGLAVVHASLGVAFRSGTEGDIRRALLLEDVVEAVIALPAGLVRGSSVVTAVWILNRDKPPARRGRVMVGRVDGVSAGRGHVEIDPEHARCVVHAFQAWEPDGDRATIVGLDALKAQDFNLNPNLYFDDFRAPDQRPIGEVLDDLAAVHERQRVLRDALDAHLRELLRELGA